MARIFQLDETGSWRESSKEFLRKKDADDHVRAVEQKLKAQQEAERKTINQKTFNDLADYYLKNYAIPAEYVGDRKTNGLRSLKPVLGYVKTFRERFGDLLLSEISHADVKEFSATRPFSAESKSELLSLHRNADPPLALLTDRSAPQSLVALISSCLSKDPSARPASFSDVEQEITRIASITSGLDFNCGAKENIFPSATLEQALSHASVSDYKTALAALDRVSTEVASKADRLAYKALILGKAGCFSQALAASSTAFELDTRSYVVLFSRAQSLLSSSKTQEAEVYIDRALVNQPCSPEALELKGLILSRLGRNQEATRYFTASHLFDQTRVDPYRYLARTHLERGKHRRSIKIAKQGLKRHGEDAELLQILGDAYFLGRKFVESIDAFKNSLRVEPNVDKTRKQFTRACLHLNDTTAQKLGTRHAKLLLGITKACISRSASTAISKRLLKLVEMLKERSSPLFLYYLDEAIITLSEVMSSAERDQFRNIVASIADQPKSNEMTSYAMLSAGKLLYQFEDYAACAVVFERVILEYGLDQTAYYYLGVCNELNENFETALENYTRGLSLNRESELLRTSVNRLKAGLKGSKSQEKVSGSQRLIESRG